MLTARVTSRAPRRLQRPPGRDETMLPRGFVTRLGEATSRGHGNGTMTRLLSRDPAGYPGAGGPETRSPLLPGHRKSPAPVAIRADRALAVRLLTAHPS